MGNLFYICIWFFKKKINFWCFLFDLLSLQLRTSVQTDFFLRLAEILGGTHKIRKSTIFFTFAQNTKFRLRKMRRTHAPQPLSQIRCCCRRRYFAKETDSKQLKWLSLLDCETARLHTLNRMKIHARQYRVSVVSLKCCLCLVSLEHITTKLKSQTLAKRLHHYNPPARATTIHCRWKLLTQSKLRCFFSSLNICLFFVDFLILHTTAQYCYACELNLCSQTYVATPLVVLRFAEPMHVCVICVCLHLCIVCCVEIFPNFQQNKRA